MKELYNIRNKSLPYYMCRPIRGEKELAAALRREFLPKIARRLPGHHLVGQKHDFIVKFVAKHKKHYPFFFNMYQGNSNVSMHKICLRHTH